MGIAEGGELILVAFVQCVCALSYQIDQGCYGSCRNFQDQISHVCGVWFTVRQLLIGNYILPMCVTLVVTSVDIFDLQSSVFKPC
jgi:hypothetical protein